MSHSPLLKAQLKDALEEFLYLPVWEDHEKRLRTIILQNCRANNTPHTTLSYRGEVYTVGNLTKIPRPMPRLCTQFKQGMDEYLREVKDVKDNEKPYVMGYIIQVLNLSSIREDHLALLPESVHRPILDMPAYSPFGAKKLADHVIQAFISNNEYSIGLLKRRQMLNLLLR